ncbi:putative oxidoreductase [Pseudocercospora fuligena]|uniref:Putative oxidoreductase n=1 Tax=Pseudocercospora fuligena TaxID=685502 RepID=A0A8H6RK06_9PEZI|nr:putative oxidoreductase [Pseudocercospora fuligena]
MHYNPDRDNPDLSGKVIIITGAIYEILTQVPAAKDKLAFLALDLGFFESIKTAAKTFLSFTDRLDILINNAGLMAVPEGLTVDGYEVQFGSNYMGPALFTKLLLPLLQQTAAQSNSDVRIINLSSELFRQAPKEGIVFSGLKTPLPDLNGLARYGQSKLAEFYLTQQYAKRHPDITSIAVHPGVVNTGLLDDFRKRRPWVGYLLSLVTGLFVTDVKAGAYTQLWAATTEVGNLRNGGFYRPGKREYGDAVLERHELSEKLWGWTEEELGGHC